MSKGENVLLSYTHFRCWLVEEKIAFCSELVGLVYMQAICHLELETRIAEKIKRT